MATKKVQTYTVPEVCEMLGITKTGELYDKIRAGDFPFPVIEYAQNKFIVPRKPVDAFLRDGKLPNSKGNRGRPKIWHKGEFVWWRFEVPIDLAEAFKMVVRHMNKSLSSPLTFNDAKRLAIEEFIERRPILDD
jgi:hypothetical protein